MISGVDAAKLENSGLHEGDIIVQVNQKDVWNPEHVSAALDEAKQAKRESILMLVEAAEGFRLVLFPVP